MTAPAENVVFRILAESVNVAGTTAAVRDEFAAIGTAAESASAKSVAAVDRVTLAEQRATVAAREHITAVSQAATRTAAAAHETETLAARSAETFKSLTAGLVGVLAIGAGFELIKKAAEAAKDDAQGIRLVGYAFGDAKKEVLEFSEAAAGAFGLSAAKANTIAAFLGTSLQARGVSAEDAAKLATQLVGRSADLGLVRGADPNAIAEAIDSGIRGKGLALGQYGIDASPAALKAEAVARGIVTPTVDKDKVAQAQATLNKAIETETKLNASATASAADHEKATANVATAQDRLNKIVDGSVGPLTAREKALAAVYKVLDQTQNQSGAFANSTDNANVQEAKLAATMENFAGVLGRTVYPALLAIGDVLVASVIPFVQTLGHVLLPVVAVFQGMPPVLQHAIGTFGVFLLLRGPLTSLVTLIGGALAGLASHFISTGAVAAAASGSVNGYTISSQAAMEAAILEAAALDEAAVATQVFTLDTIEASSANEALIATMAAVGEEAAIMGEEVAIAGREIGTAFTFGTGGLGLVLGAIGAVVSALLFFNNTEEKATTVARNFTAAINEQNGQLNPNANNVISQATKETIAAYQQAGGAVGDYTEAVLGHADAQKRVQNQLVAAAAGSLSGSTQWKGISDDAAKAGYTVTQAAQALLAGGDEAKKFTDAVGINDTNVRIGANGQEVYSASIKDVIAAMGPAVGIAAQLATDTAELAKEQKEAAAAAKDQAAANLDATNAQHKATAAVTIDKSEVEGHNQIITTAATKARDLALSIEYEKEAADLTAQGIANLGSNMDTFQSQVDDVTAALDKLAGRQPTLEEAFAKEADAINNTASAYGVGTDQVTKFGAGILYANGQINTSVPGAVAFRQHVLDMRDAIAAAALAADEQATATGGAAAGTAAAAKAAQDGYDAFIALETPILGSKSAAEKLAKAYGLIPKDITTTVDLETDKATKKAQDLLAIQAAIGAVSAVQAAGNIFTQVIGATLFPAHASGGWITAGSGPTSDDALARVSRDEFIVKAANAPSWHDELEYMNDHPKYADGGAVGAGGWPKARRPSFGGGSSVHLASGAVSITVDASGMTADQVAELTSSQFAETLRRLTEEQMDRAFS